MVDVVKCTNRRKIAVHLGAFSVGSGFRRICLFWQNLIFCINKLVEKILVSRRMNVVDFWVLLKLLDYININHELKC